MEYLKLRQEVERRLPFLFPADERTLEPESDLEHLLAERALVERILGYCASIFYNAVDDSSNIDPESGQLLLSHWEQPTLESSCLLLKRMLVRGIVRAESLFDLKGNEKASVVNFTRELIDSLQHLNELLLLAPDRPEEFTPEHARQLHGAMASCCFLIVSHLKGKGAAEEREPEAILRALEDSFSHSLSGLRALEKEKRRAARRRQRRPPTSTLYPFLAPGEDGDLLLFEGIRHGQIFYWSLRDGERVAVKNRKMVPHLLVFLMRFGLYREASVLAKTWKREVNRAMEPTLLQYLKHCDAAENYRALQEPRLASIEYEKAIRLKRQWPIPYYRRAMLHQEQGRPEKAVLELRRLLQRNGRLGHASLLTGRTLEAMGERQQAVRAFDEAIVLNPLDAEAEQCRTRVLQSLSRRKEERAAGLPAAEPAARGFFEEVLVDMTQEARMGAYHHTLGQERAVEQLFEILSCREKNNVLILGESGVGKTALVEEFVLQLGEQQGPERFWNKPVYLMSVGTLLAGARFRGQFEERVLTLIKELRDRECLLFIDHIHQIINAGLTRGGSLDASNLLKPALIRGEIQVIGATTREEYAGTIEKDPTLQRCFRTLTLTEPELKETRKIITYLKGGLEDFHRVRIPNRVIAETLPLIDSCVMEGHFPDKALDVFDRAASRVALDPDAAPGKFRTLEPAQVLEVITEISGIPAGRLDHNRRQRYRNIQPVLRQRIVGQEAALSTVSDVLVTAGSDLSPAARRPRAVFLFVGPTGVGKTETARAMAEFLFGTEERLIRIDMSEYMDRINASRLIGTAPGYVGYNDPNQLTDEVRKQPYSLLLLDEMEKADHHIFNLFLQVFDAGRLTDGKGRTINFQNTIIVMTSNVGTHLYSEPRVGYQRGDRDAVSRTQLTKELRRRFSPEFLNRVDEMVFFQPLSPADVRELSLRELRTVEAALSEEGKKLFFHEDVLELVAGAGASPEEGARNLKRVVRRLLLDPLARASLDGDWEAANVVVATVGNGEVRLEYRQVEEPEAYAQEIEEELALKTLEEYGAQE